MVTFGCKNGHVWMQWLEVIAETVTSQPQHRPKSLIVANRRHQSKTRFRIRNIKISTKKFKLIEHVHNFVHTKRKY